MNPTTIRIVPLAVWCHSAMIRATTSLALLVRTFSYSLRYGGDDDPPHSARSTMGVRSLYRTAFSFFLIYATVFYSSFSNNITKKEMP